LALVKKSPDITFDGSRACAHVTHLATRIGPRPACSKGEREAARYIAGQFRSFGLTVTTQKAPCDSYAVEKASLKLRLNGKWRSADVVPVVYSAGTPASGVEAEITICRNAADLAAARGKIALMYRPVDRHERVDIKKTGVLAVLLMDQLPHGHPRTRVIPPVETEGYRSVPTAAIRHANASDIIKAGKARARLLIVKRQRKSYSLNVIGEIAGRSKNIVVMCAHYDSLPSVPGAQDNASGTAVVLETARALAHSNPYMTMRFIAFGGEEAALIGSNYYASQLSGAGELHKHMLAFNVDVMGAPIGQHGLTYIGTSDIKRKLMSAVKAENMICDVSPFVGTSDSTPLSAVGIPSIYMTRYAQANTYLHTPDDTDRFVCAQALENGGRLTERFLARAAVDIDKWAFKRSIPRSQQDELRTIYHHRGYVWP